MLTLAGYLRQCCGVRYRPRRNGEGAFVVHALRLGHFLAGFLKRIFRFLVLGVCAVLRC